MSSKLKRSLTEAFLSYNTAKPTIDELMEEYDMDKSGTLNRSELAQVCVCVCVCVCATCDMWRARTARDRTFTNNPNQLNKTEPLPTTLIN